MISLAASLPRCFRPSSCSFPAIAIPYSFQRVSDTRDWTTTWNESALYSRIRAILELRLDASASALAGGEALARLLLRAESVASSRIEGLEVGGRRLLRADAARQLGEDPADVTASEVLANIDALAWGVDAIEPGGSVTLDILLEAHRRLLGATRLARHGGRIRTVQNWIGGSSHHPCAAEFVPPPPEAVSGLLDDVIAFSNDDSLPALAQAAIAHAQFETVHPFVDGNGRTGRVLIHLVLRRRLGVPPGGGGRQPLRGAGARDAVVVA